MDNEHAKESLETLAERTLAACRGAGLRVATAESCTGGLVAGALTAIAGSSDVVIGGLITYSDAAKHALLGVPREMIAQMGAVSSEVAEAMVEGTLTKLPEASVALSVTGIAGPGGGTAIKPVGLVHFALAKRGGETKSWHRIFAGDRTAIRIQAVIVGLQAFYDIATSGTVSSAECPAISEATRLSPAERRR